MLVWVAEGARLGLVVLSLNIVGVHLGPSQFLLIALVAALLTTVPFLPGGLGLVEAGMIGVLITVGGVTNLAAVSITLLDRSISYASLVVIGFVIFVDHPHPRPQSAPDRDPGVRALVTGGAGFIGSHITDALIDAGHTVTVVDDLSRGRRAQVNPRATFVEVDITSDALAAAVADAKPEVVFHHAAQIDVRESVRDPLHDADVNVVGTVNVLRAAVDAGTRRVIFASSGGAIYGDTTVIPTPETTACLPRVAVRHVQALRRGVRGDVQPPGRTGVRRAALRQRLRSAPGPARRGGRRRHLRGAPASRGDPPMINGDGTQTRDYVHVHDVVRANLAAVDGPRRRLQHRHRRRDRRQHASTACSRPRAAQASTPSRLPASPVSSGVHASTPNSRATQLGWAPEIAFDEGIESTIDVLQGRALSPDCGAGLR